MNNIRKKAPRIHMITNGVTRESCVNLVLSAGGYAICAEAPEEVEEVVGIADGLLLNLGMPSVEKAKAMELALQRAKERRIPVVLDPVGVGVSKFRRDLAARLLEIGGITCIRGNAGEIGYLCNGVGASLGVETGSIHVTEEALQELSARTGATVMMSGPRDYLVWKSKIVDKPGGGEVFTHMTGSGCMESALLAASIAATGDVWEGLTEGVRLFDAAGREAAAKMQGMGSFAVAFLDAMSHL